MIEIAAAQGTHFAGLMLFCCRLRKENNLPGRRVPMRLDVRSYPHWGGREGFGKSGRGVKAEVRIEPKDVKKQAFYASLFL